MPRNPQTVPFGYEPPKEVRKGTLIYYDDFEHTTNKELESAVQYCEDHFFTKLVLYPLHEETVKRMTKQSTSVFYKRADRLHDWKREHGNAKVMVEGLEGKRKKYTPIDTALRHITEKYHSPYFLYVTPEMANQFASFSSFEEWIVKLRLVLSSEPHNLHPKLEKFQHRWGLNSQ